MPGMVITSVEMATPQWLTGRLRKSGALSTGTVTGVEVGAGQGTWSTNARLRLRYSSEATGELPSRLFLKIVRSDPDDEEAFGDSEVTYYTRDYVDVPDAPLVGCHDAAYSAAERCYHLLLDDVTATHVEATHRPPTLEHALALADGLAAMHARWWGVDRLTAANQPVHDASHIQRFVDIAAPGVPHVLGHCRSELAEHWPDLIVQLFARHPVAMVERSRTVSGIHNHPRRPRVYEHSRAAHRVSAAVPDRPTAVPRSLTSWLGVYDLVDAMVLIGPSQTGDSWRRPCCGATMINSWHTASLTTPSTSCGPITG